MIHLLDQHPKFMAIIYSILGCLSLEIVHWLPDVKIEDLKYTAEYLKIGLQIIIFFITVYQMKNIKKEK